MFVEIDKKNSIPIYRQIEAGIKKKILNSELPIGAKLPAERRLAQLLGVNRNTVVKAYKLLMDQELISCNLPHRKGYFVIFGCENENTVDKKQSRAVFRYSYTSGAVERIFDDIYNASGQEKYISFGGHLLPAELIPVERIKKTIDQTIDDYGADAFSYCQAKGSPILRNELSVQMEKEGVHVRESEIVIVNETTQGLEFVTNSIVSAGDYVVTEYPIMPDAYRIFQRNGLRIIPVELEDDGVNLTQLENVLKKYKPKLFYTMPDYHSVTGIRMSLEKRNQVVELAYRYNVPVVEECWYSGMNFENQGLPSLFTLDKYKNIVTLDNVMASFYSGAKIAYVMAPEEMAEKVSSYVCSSQTHLQNLEQLVFAEYLKAGYSEVQRKETSNYYRAKREIMGNEMYRLKESGVSWKEPEGGFSYWCRLPEGVHDMHLYKKLRNRGVLIFPGKLFFPIDGGAESYMRLSISNVTDENIRKGLEIIGQEIDRKK